MRQAHRALMCAATPQLGGPYEARIDPASLLGIPSSPAVKRGNSKRPHGTMVKCEMYALFVAMSLYDSI